VWLEQFDVPENNKIEKFCYVVIRFIAFINRCLFFILKHKTHIKYEYELKSIIRIEHHCVLIRDRSTNRGSCGTNDSSDRSW